jgi:hypothetical protein
MLTSEDVPHRYTHFALFEAECGHTLELRAARPVEPKYLMPMTKDSCPWCEAKDLGVEIPDELQSKFRGGSLLRRSPITYDEYVEMMKTESEVEKDGPSIIDPGRRPGTTSADTPGEG